MGTLTKSLIGQRFGHLLVLQRGPDYVRRGKNGYDQATVQYYVRCDCGQLRIVPTGNLTMGRSVSCGCMPRGRAAERIPLRHNRSEFMTPEYVAWQNMKQRCVNPRHPQYDDFGKRGISVCNRWNDYTLFVADVGRRPNPDFALLRKKTDENYTPDNTFWGPHTMRERTRRNTHWLEWNGRRAMLWEWARDVNITRNVLYARLRNGWSVQDILTKPVAKRKATVHV